MKKYSGYKVRVQLIEEDRPQNRHVIHGSKTAYYLVRNDVKLFDREKFLVIYLDRKNHVLGINETFQGSLSGSAIYSREIFKGAILSQSAAVIFIHNHPSGDPEPSLADRKLTLDLIKAGDLLNVKVLDHIIIGSRKYYSFADEGLISQYYKEIK